MKFNYGHTLFLIRSLMLCVFFGASILLLVINAGALWIGLFCLLFFMSLLIFCISPLFTSHEMTRGSLILRQGLLFKASILFSNIEKGEIIDFSPFSYGVSGSIRKPRIVIATGKYNLVSIRLKEQMRFKHVLGKSASEIIIDVNEPEIFINELEKRINT